MNKVNTTSIAQQASVTSLYVNLLQQSTIEISKMTNQRRRQQGCENYGVAHWIERRHHVHTSSHTREITTQAYVWHQIMVDIRNPTVVNNALKSIPLGKLRMLTTQVVTIHE